METLALLFPAGISVWIWHKRNEKISWSVMPTLVEYSIWTVCNVLVSVLTVVFVFRHRDLTSEAFMSFSFFWKYMLVAVFAAFLMPYLVEFVMKCFGVTFTIERKASDKGKDKTYTLEEGDRNGREK